MKFQNHKIACKGTLFYAHSQINVTKSNIFCTFRPLLCKQLTTCSYFLPLLFGSFGKYS